MCTAFGPANRGGKASRREKRKAKYTLQYQIVFSEPVDYLPHFCFISLPPSIGKQFCAEAATFLASDTKVNLAIIGQKEIGSNAKILQRSKAL